MAYQWMQQLLHIQFSWTSQHPQRRQWSQLGRQTWSPVGRRRGQRTFLRKIKFSKEFGHLTLVIGQWDLFELSIDKSLSTFDVSKINHQVKAGLRLSTWKSWKVWSLELCSTLSKLSWKLGLAGQFLPLLRTFSLLWNFCKKKQIPKSHASNKFLVTLYGPAGYCVNIISPNRLVECGSRYSSSTLPIWYVFKSTLF